MAIPSAMWRQTGFCLSSASGTLPLSYLIISRLPGTSEGYTSPT
ncbi:hypothetical protein ID866_9200 [Astraeus odoratus]|nr:hypothetical protein ID866_9200 [Astraeus odoratus]